MELEQRMIQYKKKGEDFKRSKFARDQEDNEQGNVYDWSSDTVVEAIEISCTPMVIGMMESKENGAEDVKNSVENGKPPDPAYWAVDDVVNYFKVAGFEEQAGAFKDQEIDGKSLLLMTRNDVLTGLSLKLGPALKIYEYHVKPLQTQHLKGNSS